MQQDAFTAGVGPGGLNNYMQIKILCCYILDHVGSPLKRDTIPEVLAYEELANFFETSKAIEDLIKLGNIEEMDGCLHLTENGKKISHEMAFSLPYTVKEKSLNAISKLLASIKIRQQNKVDITEKDGEYTVTCTLLDGDSKLMELIFHVKSEMVAKNIRENFYADPFEVYSTNVQMLTKNPNA